MELLKLLGKVALALTVLAIAAVLASCSSGTLTVSAGDTRLEESEDVRALALKQIALFEESGDTLLAQALKKALAEQSVALLKRDKTSRYNLETSNTSQAAELLQMTQSALESARQPLKGMIVNHLPQEVVVRITGPLNWTLERIVKGKSVAEIDLPCYGKYSVTFIQGLRKSAVLEKPVGPTYIYQGQDGQKYDLLATAWQ